MDVLALAKINALKKSGGVGYEETAKTVVFQQNTLTLPYDVGEGMAFHSSSPAPFEIVLGKEYEVIWNGDIYKLVGSYWGESAGFPAWYIGNPMFTGGEDNGVPFTMFYIAHDSGTELCIYVLGTTETVTVSLSISTEAETVHTIDPKFLPSGGGGGITTYALKTVIDRNKEMQILSEEDCLFLNEQKEKQEGFLCKWTEDMSHVDDLDLTCFVSAFLVYNGILSQGTLVNMFAFEAGGQTFSLLNEGEVWVATYQTPEI